MMIRKGTCQNCGATYQVPVEFELQRAACRICEGAVEIGEPEEPGKKKKGKGKAIASAAPAALGNSAQASGGGASQAVAESADPAPAAGEPSDPARALLAGATEEQAAAAAATAAVNAAEEVVEDLEVELEDAEWIEEAELELEPEAPEMPAAVPAPKEPKAKGGSTLARLKAERAAGRVAEEPLPSKGGSTLERLKAERAAAASQDEAKRGGTLERLKAERAAQASGASSTGGSTLERLKAERSAQAASAAPAKAPTSRSASPSRRRAEPDEDTDRGRSGGRRGGGSSRRSGAGRRGSKERNPLPGLIGIGGVVLLLAVVFVGQKQGWFDKPAPAVEPEATEVADADKSSNLANVPQVPITNLFDDVGAGDSENAGGGDAADNEGSSDDSGKPAEASAAKDSGGSAAPAYTGPDPASIDLTALAEYAPLEGTDDETWADIQKQVERMGDPDGGLGSSKATEKVKAWGKEALPAIVNFLVQLDVTQKDDAQSGMIVTRILGEMLGDRPIGWSEETDPRNQYRNKLAIQSIHRIWGESVESEEKWAAWAQLDKAGES
jgi:hypothetical protein